MITYLTGVPGAGKSLRAMWWLNKPEYADRPVYSNMEGPDGLGLPSGHSPVPDDWTECPDGCVIVLDEVQHRWPQRGPGTRTPAEESALDTHRHRGIDFILMTQRPTGVSHHVRGLVGKHEHLKRKAGAQMSFVMSGGEAFDPKDRNQTQYLDNNLWKFPKDLYGSYKSSVEHTGTYKFKLPMKAKVGGTAILVLVTGVSILGVHSYRTFGVDESPQLAPAQAAAAPVQARPRQSSVTRWAKVVTACISTPNNCFCTNADGDRIDELTYTDCMNVSSRMFQYRSRVDTGVAAAPLPGSKPIQQVASVSNSS